MIAPNVPTTLEPAEEKHTMTKTLLEWLGMSTNPFEFGNAEEEIRHSIYWQQGERKSGVPFFDLFFIPPLKPIFPQEKLPPNKGRWFAWLLEPRPMAFLGEQGTGKSMIRLALEAWVRILQDPYLVCTISLKPGEEPFEQAVLESLQVDFVIQFLEKFPLLTSQTASIQEALTALLQNASDGIKRWVRRILHSSTGEDLGKFWPAQNRPVVRRVPVDAEALALIKEALAAIAHAPPPSFQNQTLSDLCALIQKAGFRHIFLQVEIPEDTPLYRRELERLVEVLPFETKSVFYRLYLPATFRDWVEKQRSRGLKFSAFLIQWNKETLHRLLLHRVRVCGGLLASMGEMADPKWREEFEARVLWEDSRGNPRKAMTYLNMALYSHMTHPERAKNPYLQPEDWPSPQNR